MAGASTLSPQSGKAKGHVTSTANSMGRAWLFRLIGVFLVLDAALILMTAVFFVTMWEDSTDNGFALSNRRQILWEEQLYRFSAKDGQWHEVPFSEPMQLLMPYAAVLIGIECLVLVSQASWGRRKARKVLRPLDKMAEAAARLAQAPSSVEHGKAAPNLHSLEEAIGRINIGEQLHTGDRELSGLESAINAMLARMQDSYRQQARFVSDASHELRTPITVIQGYAGMLRRWGKADEKVLDESIEAIASESSYMKRLVDQLLFLARGDTGRNRLEKKKVDAAELVREARSDAQLIDADHEWVLGRCETAYVYADIDMMKQCLRILTENAARYTPAQGTIRLRAYAEEGTVHMEVQDTGCGISAKDIPHIFERFYRADEARTRESGGSGLGLSIARWIVDSHEGHIDVFSREGIGSRFSILLPLYSGQEEALAADDDAVG